MLKHLCRNGLIASALFASFLFSMAVQAEDAGAWRAESDTYRAYLGVVPASLIRREPVLVDGDRTLHGGAEEQSSAAQHVMVAVYRKADNRRVAGATVIARVKKASLLGGGSQEKPLERMATTGGITYGNYFDMPDAAKYEIEVRIYEANRNGSEELEFSYVRP